MSDDHQSNDAGIARLINGQLTERSAKLVRRGLRSLDSEPKPETGQRPKLVEVADAYDAIPLPEEVKELASQIFRDHIESGSEDTEGLLGRFETALGPNYPKIEPYLLDMYDIELEAFDAAEIADALNDEQITESIGDSYYAIPIAPRAKEALSEIARSFVEEGRTDFGQVANEFEELLHGWWDEVVDYLPTIFSFEVARARSQKAEDERLAGGLPR